MDVLATAVFPWLATHDNIAGVHQTGSGLPVPDGRVVLWSPGEMKKWMHLGSKETEQNETNTLDRLRFFSSANAAIATRGIEHPSNDETN